MNVIKYDPFRELRGLQDEMTRLFAGVTPQTANREEMWSRGWSPRVDIFENKEHLVLEAELPGLNRDDFDLSIENNVITLKGERTFQNQSDNDNYHRIERTYGSFTRSFTLPQTVTADGADAEFRNGILTVTLPKREETKARKIEIKGEGSTSKTIETGGRSRSASA